MSRARPSRPLPLLILACALHAFASHAAAQQDAVQRLTPPGVNWSLDVSLAGFEVAEEKAGGDGRLYTLSAFSMKKGDNPLTTFTMLEVRMETAQSHEGGGGAGARDFYVKGLAKAKAVKKKSLTTFEHKGIPAVRYERDNEIAYNMTRDFGVYARQQSLEAYFAKDGVWVVVRFSATALKDPEVGLFHNILDSVRFVDTAVPVTSFDHYQRGRAFFLQEKYPPAVESLATALGLERRERQLAPTHWRSLVELLTDAYGATGSHARAKETLDYGVANEPTYPLFHLGLARFHATRGDLDNTIASLQKAFLYVENRGQMMPLPDPMYDRAFERFRKDDKFRKAVKAMKKKS